jgi:hypothetical protein
MFVARSRSPWEGFRRYALTMADSSPTVAETIKSKAITDQNVDVTATSFLADFLADPRIGPYDIASGHRVNLAAAVAGHDLARQVAANSEARLGVKLAAMLTAIPLARAEMAIALLY